MKIKPFICFASLVAVVLSCSMAVGIKGQEASAMALDGQNTNSLLATGEIGEEEAMPSSYCMRDEYIVYAQHQDKHGYCWNFAATMSASTTIMRHTNEYYDFSELWNGIACFNGTNYYPKIGGGGYFDYYSVIASDKNYAIYTNQLSGNISFVPTEYTSIYSDKNMSIPTLSYHITDGVGCTVTYTVTSNSGYPLQYNFHVEYYEDTALQPVNVYYDLGGGINHPKNYGKEMASNTTDLLLYEPTREGYTFKGWYVSNSSGTKQLRQEGDVWYIDWEDIHHMGESPTLWASSYYKKYYKNSNVVFVQARWEETKHVITWKNWDGTELYKEEYSFGAYPIYDEEKGIPTKPEDEKYHYIFVGWEPRVESVDKDASYTAVYKAIPKEYTISVSSSENGTVTSSGNGTVTCLDVLTYTFTPNEGYKIKDVKVDGVSVGAVPAYTFAGVTSNRTLLVEFETIQNKIVLSIEGKGNATGDKDLNEVIFGDSRTITFTPEEDWQVLCAFVNGERMEITKNQLTLTSIKEEMQVVVVFEEKESNVAFLATVIPTSTVAISSTGALIYIGCRMRKKRSISKTLGDSSLSSDGE